MRRLLKDQSGIALVMSVGMLAVLSIVGTTTLVYTTANARSGVVSKDNERAFSLAEAGLNNAMAVLSLPTNNALESTLLPSTEATASSATYEGGTSKWYGTLDRAAAMWTVTSLGLYANPTGVGAAQVRRKLVAKVPVIPTNTQTNNNPAWNYIYARATGSTCDVTLNNNLAGQSRFYVAGNLCLDNNVAITSESLIVQGNVDLSNNAAIGTSDTRVETYVGGNCRYGGGSWATPCTGNQDSRHIFSKLMPGGSVGVNNTAPVIPEPAADLALWYEDAAPGPAQSCTASSGTPPTFDDNYPNRNNNLGTFELTPATSYMCRVGPGANTTLSGAINASQTTLSVASASGFPTTAFRIRIDDEQMNVTGGFGTNTWTVTRGANGTTAATHVTSQTVTWDDSNNIGLILWNATTKTLTLKGTIFIDGSASITNGTVNKYDGQSTLYLSGVFYINNSSKLCGGVSGSECAFAAWNPNNELLTVVTNGSGGMAGTGNGILIDNNAQIQGGLFAAYDVQFINNARSDGPIVGRTVKLANNVQNDQFPTITSVPAGMPGNPIVYAQPNPPQLFAG
jgi:Tfp pilus assembly protein PilX